MPVAGFTVFGLQGESDEEAARDECGGGRNCTEERKDELQDAVDQKFLLANISVSVGIAGAAAGTVLFFLAQGQDNERASSGNPMVVDVYPTNGGSLVSVSGSF